LAEFEAAGIPPEAITIVMATGTHGAPQPGALKRKVGELAASRCQLRIHDHLKDVVRLGRTSFGTPVFANRIVAGADYVIGIGGVYPQHTTWFGGGSKLVLGVLGERSIANLHYRHWKLDTRYALDNDFRQDLNEVAALVGLKTSISLHINGHRKAVRMSTGDPRAFYSDEATFSRDAFRVPMPGDADVVISNAYPMDLSLTFAQAKGTTPLKHASPTASRVVVASCPEGDGHHGLFPLVRVPRHYYRVQWLRRQLIARAELRQKIVWRLKMADRRPAVPAEPQAASRPTAVPASMPPAPSRQIHLYRPLPEAGSLDVAGTGIRVSPEWDDVLAHIAREQGGRRQLRAVVYPCSPLQILDFTDELAAAGADR
jgi:hypothetical protein